MLPNFVVIGAQKAGSTFVQNCLAQSPDVYMRPGELPFFEDPDYDPHKLPRFEALFAPGQGKKAVGFKRPNYLSKPEVPPRLAKHLPHAKLIAVLRHPVERAFSAYFHYVQRSQLPVAPIQEGLRNLLEGRYNDSYPGSHEILEFGNYAKHFHRYLEHFDRNAIHVLLLDDIKADSMQAVRTICDFLDVQTQVSPESLNERPMAVPYSLPRVRILRALMPLSVRSSPDHSRIYPRGALGKLAGRCVATLDQAILAKLFKNEKPKLDPQLAQRLLDYYRPDILQLEQFLGRPLSKWLAPKG